MRERPDWDRLKGVFEGARELAGGKRAAFLAEACGGDEALRREAEELLRAHDAASGFLETPAAERFPISSGDPGEDLVGSLVGPFRIIAEIGHGGMGAVYRARREGEGYTQDVALKVVRAELASAGFTARFRQERRILARLEHPNVARLIDGGTTDDGRPYYAMEFVDGQPLDRYCVEKSLGLRARLELFRQVCDAVAYAHRNLVVHRDLKPGNILVSADGAPKLLDFGIAKLTSAEEPSEAGQTGTGIALMTPDYASPEQVRGDPVTTSTDIYALGILFYVLLTNRRPYKLTGRGAEELVRVVCQEDRTAPSEVAAAVRREAYNDANADPKSGAAVTRWHIDADLDTIALKAVRKEPEGRYASAADLSEDVRRYLAGLPIQARPDTIRYRTSRFIARHRGAVAAAAVAILALVGGGVATMFEARIAESNRKSAEKRFEDLRHLARSNLFELHDAIQALPGSATARHLLIQRSVQYLDGLNAETSGRRDLQEELALGYQRIANLQGNFSGPGIGDSQAALTSYKKAVGLREGLLAGRSPDAAGLLAESEVLFEYAQTLLLTGQVADASSTARRAIDRVDSAVRLAPDDIRTLKDETLAHLQAAVAMGGTGSSGSTRELAAAIEHDRRALTTLARLVAKEPRLRYAALQMQMMLGFHFQKTRAFSEAARVFDAVLSDDRTRSMLSPIWLVIACNSRGLMFEHAGDQRKALEAYQLAFSPAVKLAEADRSDLTYQINFAIAQAHIGMQTARLGQPAVGRRQLDEGIKMAETLLSANPSMSFYKDLLMIGYAYQAEVLSMLGDQAGAEAKCRSALKMASDVSRADQANLEPPLRMAKLEVALAVVLSRSARHTDAAHALDAARAHIEGLLRLRPDDAEGAHVRQIIQDNATGLKGCTDGRACGGTSRLRLPSFVD